MRLTHAKSHSTVEREVEIRLAGPRQDPHRPAVPRQRRPRPDGAPSRAEDPGHVAGRARRFVSSLAAAIDLLGLVVVLALAVLVLPGLDATGAAVAIGTGILWLAVIAVRGGYDEIALVEGGDGYRRLFVATMITTASSALVVFLADLPLARNTLLTVVLGGLGVMVLSRATLRRVVRAVRSHGALTQRVLLVGDEAHVDEFADVLDRRSELGYRVVGALTPGSSSGVTAGGVEVWGPVAAAVAVAHRAAVDVVFFAGGALSSSAELRTLTWELRESDVRIVVAPSVTDVAPERITMRPVAGVPLLHLDKPRVVDASKSTKRLFDVVGAALLLLLAAPLFLYVSVRIWRFDGGPVFFRHERVGLHGRPFGCWKFRTMVTNADERLAELLRERGVDGAIFAKLKDDPRITAPGRWLRRLSLDELPQLLNVLTGTMSLVGPRPQTASEVAEYDEVMARRLHVKPGMTGLWQVSGRSDLSVDDAVRLDAYYVENWSMARDLGILARTPGAVMTGRGAY